MLFRVIDKGDFKTLVEKLLETNEVVAPKKVADDRNGKPLHQYLPIESFEEMNLDYETTSHSAKTYFLPYKENLSIYKFENRDWSQEIKYRIQPRALIGLHACDINALLKLDRVMVGDVYPSPYYISRRENTFIVGIDHKPCEGGFCKSLGTATVSRGFDLFLTDLGDRYFVAVGSDRGYTILNSVPVKGVGEKDTKEYLEVKKEISRSFENNLDTRNLPTLMDIEFESDVWTKWGDKCFSCGSCAMVCPTCYCYGVKEELSMDSIKSCKVKQLYSCSIVDFAEVAGGHNFRPEAQTRLKYRYYHQHKGFSEAYDQSKCVGCGRCGRACVAGITPPDIIRDLIAEEQG